MFPNRLRDLGFYTVLGFMAVGALALLPGDETAQPAVATAALISEPPQRPSYISATAPVIEADEVVTASIAPVAAPAETQAMPEPLVAPTMTVASLAPGPAAASQAFPMDAPPEAEPAFPTDAELAEVSSAVNMRAGPSTSTQTLRVLKPGEQVHVIETSGGWLNVALADGSVGWVYSRYVGGEGAAAEEQAPTREASRREPERGGGDTIRLDNDIVLRSGPSRTSQRLFRVEAGERVAIVERRRNWVRVELEGGVSGWVPTRSR